MLRGTPKNSLGPAALMVCSGASRCGAGPAGRTRVDIHAEVAPRAVLQRVLLAQLIQHVSGVKAGVVAQLARDDLQRLGKRVDEQLRFARD